jgi:hypothetical protein
MSLAVIEQSVRYRWRMNAPRDRARDNSLSDFTAAITVDPDDKERWALILRPALLSE